VAKSFADSLTLKSSDTIMNIISAANNGMNIFDFDLNIPQTSSNLGKVILASKQAEFGWLQRSNKPYCLAKLNNKLISLFELAGSTYEISSYTDSLDPAFDNPFALQIQSIAKKYFKHKANITATHTVLELGTIVTHYPNMIAVSIGANIRSPHTPNEKVEISSVLYTYNLLKKVLQEIN
jgi:dipeptidase D